jgi:hypothetical protein
MLELAKQAGLKKDHASDREYTGDFDWRLFGHLIVRECADIVASSSLPDAYSEPCLAVIAEEIKKHLGVE